MKPLSFDASATGVGDAVPVVTGGDYVFIDSRVPDLQDLLAGIKPGELVYLINPDTDGLQQIADILAANHASGLSGIQIVSHGSAGEIEIGSTVLNDSDLAQHSGALAALGTALGQGGALSLFACNTAAGASGQQFIADLSQFIGGADVAASTHNVGSAAAGGNWTLDASTGAPIATVPFGQDTLTGFDGTLSGTIDGQIWYGIDSTGTNSIVGHVNSDASNPNHNGNDGTNTPSTIGFDLAAGYYFQTDSDDSSISAYKISDGSLVNTVQIGARPGGLLNDIVNAMVVDPLNHVIYVGRWGTDLAHSGIIKVSYSTTTGTLDTTAAFNSSPNFIVSGTTSAEDIRDFSIDLTNQVLYYSDNDNHYTTSPFVGSNAIYKVSTAGGTPTLLSSTSQFPSDNSAGAIGPLVIDTAKSLIYFETSNFSTGLATLWYMPITGGTAFAVSLPGGSELVYGDYPQGGLSLDPQSQQLYIVEQSSKVGGTPVSGSTNQLLQGQLSSDGHTITSWVQIESINTLDGATTNPDDHIVGTSFDQLPTLSITGTTTHAVEQSATITLPTAESSSDPDANHYAGATVQITGGTFSSNESSTNDDHLTIAGASSGTVAGTSITFSWNSATETLTLSGYDTVAHYNTALAAVSYNTTGDNPTNYNSNTTRTITWIVSDGAQNVPTGQQNSGTTTLTVDGVNDASSLGSAGNSTTYIEQHAAGAVDSGITVTDPDNLTQASATVTISAGLQAGDTLHFTNIPATMGNVAFTSYSGGVLTLTSAGATATLAQWQAALQAVTFDNQTNDDPTAGGATTRTVTWVINDGSVNSSSVTSTINITPVNDAPTLTATGLSPGFTEAAGLGTQAAAVTLFSTAAAGTIESGQNILGLTFTVSGLHDGANESIVVDGKTITLGATSSGTTTTNGMSYTATVSGGNATVVLTKAGGVTTSAINTLINGITYQNTSTDDPTAGNRVFTVTQIQDSGGTANSGVDTTTVSIASTVAVTPVNDAPSLSATAANPTFTEAAGLGTQASAVALFSGAAASTIEAAQTVTSLTFTVSGLADGANESIVVDGKTITLGATSSGTTTTNSMSYTSTVSGGTATVVLTKAGGISSSAVNTLINAITYQDTSTDDPTAGNRVFTLIQIVDNGGTANSGHDTTTLSIASTVTVTPVNDAPALTATGLNPGFTEAAGLGTQASAVSVFSTASAGTIESGQSIIGLTFTVGGLADGANESIVVDGKTITLGATSSGTTTTNGMSYTATVSGGTATVVLTKAGGVTTSAINTLINGITYQDTSADDPTAGNRVFTLTQIQDSGGTANSGHDTTTLAIASTVAVTAVNDAPSLSATAANPTFTEAGGLGTQASAVALFSGAAASTIEAAQTVTSLTFTVSGLADGANESIVVDGKTITLGATSSGTTTTNSMSYTSTVSGGNATVVLTKAGGISSSAVNTLVNGLTYQDTNTDNPTAGDRVFTLTQIKDNGGTANSGADTTTLSVASTVHVAAVNDAPALANAGNVISYTEQAAAVAVDSAITVSDPDNATLVSATVTISAGLQSGDTLHFANNPATMGNIAFGSYSGGVLTLTSSGGTATLAQWQAALQSVTFDNSSNDDPTAGGTAPTRTLAWQVDDGQGVNHASNAPTTTINVTAVDDAAVAANDAFTTDQATAIGSGLNLFNNNGSGPDHDPDGPAVTVATVNGSAGNVGSQITLPSGAHLTVHTDGTFSYDPNHAFDSLDLAPAGSGAANSSTTDTFTYTVDGGASATVTLTINGIDTPSAVYDGSSGNDTIHEGNNGNLVDLSQGGNDTVVGGTGDDGFYFGAAYTSADHVDGGAGTNDQIGIQGNYGSTITLSGTSIVNVEVVAFLAGDSYSVTTTNDLLASGQSMIIWAKTANGLTFDGSNETDGGKFVVYGSITGNDTITGGAANDTIYGMGGADTLTGGGGANTFGYTAVTDSTSTGHDTITDFDAAADLFHFPVSVLAVDSAIVSGALNAASFDTDLATDVNGTNLAANHAVLFTASTGDLSGHTFLIVDANGAAGYQASQDYVVDVTGIHNAAGLSVANFV